MVSLKQRRLAATVEQRPNIVVILTDSHAAFASGCYGSPAIRTPNLDLLASKGVLFEEAYCQNTICLPSRASSISGTYSYENGAIHNEQPYPADIYTIGDHLHTYGYDTAAFGKMHFVPDQERSLGKDCHRGFDQRVDFEEFYWYLRRERGLPPLPGVPDDPYRIHWLERYVALMTIAKAKEDKTLDFADHQESLVLREWRDYLKQGHEKPFLAYVSFQSPHGPFLPTHEFLRLYDGVAFEPPELPGEFVMNHPYLGQRARQVSKVTREARERYLRYYAAFITFSDYCTGQVMQALEEAGYSENTLVLYHSDHGEMGFQHGLVGKSVFYDYSVRVPMVMYWPGHVEGGWHYQGLVELVDVFPTLCDVASVSKPEHLPGRSLLRDLTHQTGRGKEAAFSEMYPMLRDQPGFGVSPHRMVCTDEWRYIQYGPDRENLFHRATDPQEKTDLAEDGAYADKVKGFRQMLLERMGELPEPEERLLNGYYERQLGWYDLRAQRRPRYLKGEIM
jgi:arylsulfatase A-like enzyme